MKTIHKDYQEILAILVAIVVVFLIFLLSGFASGNIENFFSGGMEYFWIACLFSLFITTLGVAIIHAIKNRRVIVNNDEKPTKSFYSYWPYEHPPWM